MFYSSVSQACDEMNSRAQGRRSTVSKFAYKKTQKNPNLQNNKHLQGHCTTETV